MIKIVVGNITSKIVGHLPQEVQEDLQDNLSYKVANARHMPKVKNGQWDGMIRLYWKHKGQSFYTGLMALVRETLKVHNIPYTFMDQRIVPAQNMPDLKFIPPDKYQERDYQQFTLDRATNFTRGILQVATGGGKTLTVTEAISRIKTYPFLFFVTTKDLMEQAHDVLSGSLNTPIGMIGDGKADIQKISVCTVQTAIMALNQNKKLKLDDYIFDDEDKWDEKGIDSAAKAEKIRKLIRLTNGAYFDECVSGDTKIVTENGVIRIDDVPENKCRFVQTYDGNNVSWKPILNWWDKGERETLKIELDNGRLLVCTKEHKIYTDRGWMEAGNLNPSDRVSIVDADAELNCRTTSIAQENTSWVIKLRKGLWRSGKKYTKSTLKNCLFVFVGVVRKLALDTRLWLSSLRDKGQNVVMRNSCQDTTSNHLGMSTTLNPRWKKNRLYLAPASGIQVSRCPIKGLETIDWRQIMDIVRLNGLIIRHHFCRDLESRSQKEIIPGTDMSGHVCIHHVCRVLQILQEVCIRIPRKISQKKYWNRSEMLGLHGGSVMTEACQESIYSCIQRGIQKKKTTLFKNGLRIRGLLVKFLSLENIFISFSRKRLRLSSLRELRSSSRCVCSTSWCNVKSIKNNGVTKVYDIEVDETHCFFGNGILVHNCHHAAAKTCKEVMTSCTNAYWRFGGSATPYRESGDGIMIQAMFGSKIVNISASYLIQNKWLVKPYIFMEPVHSDDGWKSYAKVYENSIVKNTKFNDHVAHTANHLVGRGLSTLVLVQHYPQGDYLKSLIPNCEFVSGRMTSSQRKQSIQDLRDKKAMCMIATTLADEGLDIPTLDAALLAGGGASATRVNQRVGRTLRKDKDRPKDKSIVVMYEHDSKYLDKHAKKVRSILKKEKEFEVMTSKGADFICGEIDSVMGLKNNDSSVLEL